MPKRTPPPPRLHEIESLVMEEVWRRDKATVREVMDALNERTSKRRAYTTVMTIMSRLHRKGVLNRTPDGYTYVYAPRLSRERYAELRADSEVDALVREYGDVALVQFARRMGNWTPSARNVYDGSRAVSSARRLYRWNIALALGGAAAVWAAAIVALTRIGFDQVPAARLLSDCGRFLIPDVGPGQLAVLILGVLAAVVFARAVSSLIANVQASRALRRGLRVTDEVTLLGTPVLLIQRPAVEAFCAGLIRPRVYLSRMAQASLPASELEAVITHEAHHVARRDPLRILLMAVFADALFFMPVLRRLERRYQALAEIAADEAAVAAVDGPAPLAAAMLRLGDDGAEGVVGITADRVDHLAGAGAVWRPPPTLLFAGCGTVAGLGAIVLAVATRTGSPAINLPALAAQSCMLLMTAVPALVAIAAVGCLARAIRARSR
jgi:predicted transcriptional regulator